MWCERKAYALLSYPGNATADHGREPREQNWLDAKGEEDGMIISHVNHSDASQWPFGSFCMQKMLASARCDSVTQHEQRVPGAGVTWGS